MKKIRFFSRVALKYWRSKKSFSIINIISGISFWGIAVGTMALVLVLSAFNGLEEMVDGMYNAFHTDLKIEPAKGKFFQVSNIDTESIEQLDGVENWSLVIEEIALLRYSDRQKVVRLKGIQPKRGYEERFDELLIDGRFKLQKDSTYFCIPGAGIYYDLGMNLSDQTTIASFYSPRRTSSASADISSFLIVNAMPKAYFSVQQEFDDNYVLVPYDLCAELFEYEGDATSIEIYLEPGANSDKIETELQNMLGDRFMVKNRYEQEEALYKIMKSEKLIVFIILAFILLITSFNLISTLTLVILDKRKNLAVLHAMGAKIREIRSIFLIQGMLIGLAGLLVGLVLGLGITWAQLQFGLVRMEGSGSFVFTAYPVKIVWMDMAYISITVLLISFLVSQIPVRRISKQWLSLR